MLMNDKKGFLFSPLFVWIVLIVIGGGAYLFFSGSDSFDDVPFIDELSGDSGVLETENFCDGGQIFENRVYNDFTVSGKDYMVNVLRTNICDRGCSSNVQERDSQFAIRRSGSSPGEWIRIVMVSRDTDRSYVYEDGPGDYQIIVQDNCYSNERTVTDVTVEGVA